MTRKCSTCGITDPNLFSPASKWKCKACNKQASYDWRKKNPERWRQLNKSNVAQLRRRQRWNKIVEPVRCTSEAYANTILLPSQALSQLTGALIGVLARWKHRQTQEK